MSHELRRKDKIDLPFPLLCLSSTFGKHEFMRAGGSDYASRRVTF